MNNIGLTKQKLCGFILLIFLSLFPSSCDKGFEEMNKNPNAYTEPVLGSMFSAALIRHAGTGDNNALDPNAKQAGCWVQYFASMQPVEWYSEKYLWRQGYYDRFFSAVYSTELKEVMILMDKTKNNPDLVNLYNIARIHKVSIIHRCTDMYGDVPYTEAGLGALEGIYTPKYDRQADIYADMLKELEEAAKALDGTKTSFGNADFVYKGDVTKWRTRAYSLMLRLGMRLTKVNPTMAETWVKKAIAGGVFQSNADMPMLAHTSANSTTWNVPARLIQTQEGVPVSLRGKTLVKINKTFCDYLLSTNDPRIPFYMTLWQGNANVAQLGTYSNPAIQKGLPGGQDQTTMKDIIPDWTDEMRPEFSEPNIHTMLHLEAPTVYQSYAEIELLLAEAALRGWGPGTAKEHYEKAVLASMLQQTLYPNGPTVAAATAMANSYLSANPYIENGFDSEMKQIHMQFWVSLYMDTWGLIESFSNWRRTGHPELTGYNYPGNETGGIIPRRSRYSAAEFTVNTENVEAAVAVQGADLFTTRVWWDKE